MSTDSPTGTRPHSKSDVLERLATQSLDMPLVCPPSSPVAGKPDVCELAEGEADEVVIDHYPTMSLCTDFRRLEKKCKELLAAQETREPGQEFTLTDLTNLCGGDACLVTLQHVKASPDQFQQAWHCYARSKKNGVAFRDHAVYMMARLAYPANGDTGLTRSSSDQVLTMGQMAARAVRGSLPQPHVHFIAAVAQEYGILRALVLHCWFLVRRLFGMTLTPSDQAQIAIVRTLLQFGRFGDKLNADLFQRVLESKTPAQRAYLPSEFSVFLYVHTISHLDGQLA